MGAERANDVCVLVVEDDEDIGSELQQTLTGYGYDTRWARTAGEAVDLARTWNPTLVLLDLGLPDADGVSVCRTLRGLSTDLLIIVITARMGELDVVLALDAGADDYLTKPVRVVELLARLRAHLRRRPGNTGVMTAGRLRLDLAPRRVTVDGVEVRLRPKEFDLLAVLAAHAGEVVSREHLMADVWDDAWAGASKTLDVHVSALRRKLADRGLDGSAIDTVRGKGYRLQTPV